MKNKEPRSQSKKKLGLALVSLICAAVVLAMGSFAWYTLSTNPEMSGFLMNLDADQYVQISLDNVEYTYSEELKIGEDEYAPLVPVSTIDGLNWFICKYDSDGNVLQYDHDGKESQYMYLRFPEGGNVELSDASDTTGGTSGDTSGGTTGGTSGDTSGGTNNNDSGNTGTVKEGNGNKSLGQYSYYIYKDIYLKTDKDAVDVYLSLPNANVSNVTKNELILNEDGEYDQNEETEKSHYGSFVMSYRAEKDETTGNNVVTLLDKTSETSARVGFMVLGEVVSGVKNKFVMEDDYILHPEDYFVTSNKEVTVPKIVLDDDDNPSYSGEDKYNAVYDTELTQVTNRFVIYEPNANIRSYAPKENSKYNSDKYISGFYAKSYSGEVTTTSSDNTTTTKADGKYSEFDDYYFPTYPIAATTRTLSEIENLLSVGVKYKTTLSDGKVRYVDGSPEVESRPNDKILEWSLDNEVLDEGEGDNPNTYVDGDEYRLFYQNLIIQRKSIWKDPENAADWPETKDDEEDDNQDQGENQEENQDSDEDEDEEEKQPENPKITLFKNKRDTLAFDATMIKEMGSFINASDIKTYYEGDGDSKTYKQEGYLKLTSDATKNGTNGNADYDPTYIDGNVDSNLRSEAKITTLYKDRPQKIRIYFWIEGQDVDCWNDIANTSFLVNLEFVADEADTTN